NPVAGALGGAGGGQLLTALLPMLAGSAGGLDIGTMLGQAVGGGVAGAIVTAGGGLIKNAMAGPPARGTRERGGTTRTRRQMKTGRPRRPGVRTGAATHPP